MTVSKIVLLVLVAAVVLSGPAIAGGLLICESSVSEPGSDRRLDVRFVQSLKLLELRTGGQ